MAGERQFAFNRIMIFIIYAVALLLPLLYPTIKTYVFVSPNVAIVNVATPVMNIKPELNMILAQPIEAPTSAWLRLLLWVYLTGIIATTVRLLISISTIFITTQRKDHIQLDNGYILVITDNENFSPFSFLRYIVISRNDYIKSKCEILIHEFTHLRKFHWLDQIFANIVAILMWYNPAAWLMIEELKSVHEFQADEAVMESGTDIKRYQYLLIEKAVGKRFPSPANSLNHSKLKQRITMMYKSKSSTARRLASIAVIPVTFFALAITDIPAFAGAISEIESTSLRDKVTNISSDSQMEENENSVNTTETSIPEHTDNNGKLVGQPVQVAGFGSVNNNNGIAVNVPDLPESTVIVGDIKSFDFNPSQDVMFFINEKEVSYSEIASLDPEKIEAVAVNSNDGKLDEVRFTVNDGKSEEKTVYTEVDEKPEFPGGEAEKYKWISQQLKYPEASVKRKAEGKVVVSFVVDKTGKINDCKIASGEDPDLCKEALRVVSIMPNWTPGKINGKAVDCQESMPISFKLK